MYFLLFSFRGGYSESFNGKLRDQLPNGEIFYTLREAKVLLERWRWLYNHVRPHSSLGFKPPAPEATLPGGPGSAPLRLALQATNSGHLANVQGHTWTLVPVSGADQPTDLLRVYTAC